MPVFRSPIKPSHAVSLGAMRAQDYLPRRSGKFHDCRRGRAGDNGVTDDL
jgi:hypothetical protein